jgi:hypothetical protein
MPVVEPRPLEIPVVGGEAELPDKMEGRTGGPAESGNIAGVGRDLRFHEDDMKR